MEKVYLAYIDWPYGMEPIGIFSTTKKAQDYFYEHYVGKKYNKNQVFDIFMLNIDGWKVDPTS
jgi:hypothetical protein